MNSASKQTMDTRMPEERIREIQRQITLTVKCIQNTWNSTPIAVYIATLATKQSEIHNYHRHIAQNNHGNEIPGDSDIYYQTYRNERMRS